MLGGFLLKFKKQVPSSWIKNTADAKVKTNKRTNKSPTKHHIKTWCNLEYIFTVITKKKKNNTKPAVPIYKGI